ncbi:Tat pathway signal protein [Streptomyces flaveus]|uniref:Tat pathway signal protein n=1 Tax=Streptomyces flaveus TaxID=66370 RepID=UPI00333135A2
MLHGITLKGVRNKLVITAAAAGLLVSFTGSAHADGGYHEALTKDRCGWAGGSYQYWDTGTAGGHTKYVTVWDFDIARFCGSKTDSLYTTFWKWNGSSWVWHNYTKIPAKGEGHDVRGVNIFLCHVGEPASCGPIERA